MTSGRVYSGFEESVPYAKIRPLDAKFKSLPGQAQEARLSFVQPISIDKDYGQEALDMFNHFTEVSVCSNGPTSIDPSFNFCLV